MLELFPKGSVQQPGLSQVLRASVHENQGNLYLSKKISIKEPVLSQFQILEALIKQTGLIIESID